MSPTLTIAQHENRNEPPPFLRYGIVFALCRLRQSGAA